MTDFFDPHDDFYPLRASDMGTLPRVLVTSSAGSFGSGNPIAMAAVAKASRSFTQIRFRTNSTAPSGTYTDCRAGVWAADGVTKVSETANAVATVTAASTVYTLALGTTVTVTRGDILYLGVAFIATSMPTICGIAGFASTLNITPVIARQGSGWTTGSTLPNLSSSNSAAMPWIELVP